ncbi:helix-turn-helix transcriptional regulator [Paenibacillus crassostreae]|uniref:helix-turn-helix transcriptional regulator n=1 Tax=Paenibacillus crassostreae TaxID=1763538 RepID=UPI0009EE5821
MADHCHVKADTINLIRRNKNQPSLPVAIKICEFLNCDMDDLFHLEENPDYVGE